jgi:hypothetical protein
MCPHPEIARIYRRIRSFFAAFVRQSVRIPPKTALPRPPLFDGKARAKIKNKLENENARTIPENTWYYFRVKW